jgi:PBP1b-binding outer membrane lipoprotein LpoB
VIYLFTGGAVALLLLQGCASDPAPVAQLQLTEQVLEQAQTITAGEQIAELALAEDKLRKAHAAMLDEHYRSARILAEQAELDARLAEARVVRMKNEAQLLELTRQNERIRKQLEAMP